MALRERIRSDAVIEARRRYVARGVAAAPRLEDPEGRSYIDFAGGLGCQNTGHGPPAAVAAMHEQIDRYLHQCFMVGLYEPYVQLCRRLAELSPCRGEDQKSLLVNSGAEAVENAVKIARAATGRPAVLVFGNAFHGRTLLTLAMTAKADYKRGFGPFPAEVYRAPAPYPYRGVDSTEALRGIELLFRRDLDPEAVSCAVLEPVQGEGGFLPMPGEFLVGLRELCDRHGILYVDDEVQTGVGRTGPVWAVDHYGIEPDLLVSGKSLGGGLPLAAVTGRAEIVDAVAPGGLGGTFGGNPVACAAGLAVLEEVASAGFRRRAEEIGRTLRARLDAIAAELDAIGEVRGLGPMLALELVHEGRDREPAPELASATTAAAHERGLVLLSCGLYGNVVRVLVPLVVTDRDLAEGLDILEESLRAACGQAA